MPSANSLTVFISHSSKDSIIALALARLIRAAFNLGQKDIRSSFLEDYKTKAGKGISKASQSEAINSAVFVAVLTKNLLNSFYCVFEMGARWGANKEVFAYAVNNQINQTLKKPLSDIVSQGLDNSVSVQHFLEKLAEKLQLNVVQKPIVDDEIKNLLSAVEAYNVALEQKSSV